MAERVRRPDSAEFTPDELLRIQKSLRRRFLPLSDNIVLIGGVQAMTLGQGLKDIYNRDHLFAIFLNARFQF